MPNLEGNASLVPDGIIAWLQKRQRTLPSTPRQTIQSGKF